MATNLKSASLAASNEIVRKFVPNDQPTQATKGAAWTPRFPECKSFIELPDGTLVEDCALGSESTIEPDEITTTIQLAKAALALARLDLNF